VSHPISHPPVLNRYSRTCQDTTQRIDVFGMSISTFQAQCHPKPRTSSHEYVLMDYKAELMGRSCSDTTPKKGCRS
jgi:hypothetical protein